MLDGKLEQQELEDRIYEVFGERLAEEVYDIYVEDDGKVTIECGETGTKQEQFRWVYFDYDATKDLEGRPEALDYLLGNRDDFDD